MEPKPVKFIFAALWILLLLSVAVYALDNSKINALLDSIQLEQTPPAQH